jgi:proline racemase
MNVEKMISIMETHSSGETTKVVMRGFPKIQGKTMIEKTRYCEKHFDNLRKAIMTQPRGFSGILGAIITEPTVPEADFGAIFLYTDGYFNSCGDSTFAIVRSLLESGMVEAEEPLTKIVLDTAGGVVRAEARLKNGSVNEISFEGVPSFYQESANIEVPELGKIEVDVAFGGLYYVFVDPKDAGVQVEPKNSEMLISTGMRIINAANKQIKVEHPENRALSKIELVTFSAKAVKPDHHFRHANVYANTICVSPAGTSVSAKLAMLWAKKKIRRTDSLIVESLIHPDLTMKGQVGREVKVGAHSAIVPRLSAKAYVVGLEHCILEKDDPIKHGFLLG